MYSKKTQSENIQKKNTRRKNTEKNTFQMTWLAINELTYTLKRVYHKSFSYYRYLMKV